MKIWRKFLDTRGYAGAILTDLSKAFDCIDPELLLVVKLNDTDTLKFIYSYIRGRKQSTKINSSYISFAKIFFGVPQGSSLGPLLFITYMYDLFHDIDDLYSASFAGDNTP